MVGKFTNNNTKISFYWFESFLILLQSDACLFGRTKVTEFTVKDYMRVIQHEIWHGLQTV